MNPRHSAALLGFAFAAAWIALNFGYALLCLLGAGVFYALAAVFEGDVDLGELQSRVTERTAAPPSTRRTVRRTRVR